MDDVRISSGRRERAKKDKRDRIMMAARELFPVRGVGGVTTQQIADLADVAIGTLYLYASTKAELLIMVQNEKFAAAIDDGLSAAESCSQGVLEEIIALIRPVVVCVREQIENGRTYLHELVFGDPAEPNRREGLALAARLEDGIASLLTRTDSKGTREDADAITLARVVTAIMHISVTASIFLQYTNEAVLEDIRTQIRAILTTHSPVA
ncbi:hypothetical protein GCM10022381_12090 [Leifsonia kafniensis]|uniref:HTH tetR-type domain-containing protein n=1 Tax=Leifsonia kafniensis TaxID=475957 RepID=A0ABP7K9X6_9MICO